MSTKQKGAFLTMFGGACWGISGCIGQYMFTYEGMDSRWLVPIRLGIAGILMLVYCYHKSGKAIFLPWSNHKDRRDLIIYGLFGVSFCQFFYFATIQLSNAAIGTILQDLSPIMILIAGCCMEKRRAKPLELAAIGFALLGVFLLSTHGNLSNLTISVSALITGILSAVCVTIYNVTPKRLLQKYPVALLQGWAFFMGSVFFSLVFRPWSYHYTPSWIGILGIAFVVLIGNVFAFTCYMKGVNMIGPAKSILYGFSEPAVAAIISFTVLGSPFSIYDLFGFIAMFIMLVCVSKA